MQALLSSLQGISSSPKVSHRVLQSRYTYTVDPRLAFAGVFLEKQKHKVKLHLLHLPEVYT